MTTPVELRGMISRTIWYNSSMENEVPEKNLPPFLAHDLDAWKRGVKEHFRFLDCLRSELYGSINSEECSR